jgi:hypothetical protein
MPVTTVNATISNYKATPVGNVRLFTGTFAAENASGDTVRIKTQLNNLVYYEVFGATGYNEETSGSRKNLLVTGLPRTPPVSSSSLAPNGSGP